MSCRSVNPNRPNQNDANAAAFEPGGAPGVPRIGAGTHRALARPRARQRESGADPEPAEAFEAAPAAAPSEAAALEQTLLDRIPIGILLYRHDSLLYANRHFLEWSGYESLDAIESRGGLNRLFAGPPAHPRKTTPADLFDPHASGYELPAEGRMFTVPWQGSSALALVLTNGQAEAALEKMERASPRPKAKTARSNRSSIRPPTASSRSIRKA